MNKKLTADSYSYIAVIIIGLVIIALSVGMPYYESKLLPLIFGGGILVLSVIGLWRNIKTQSSESVGIKLGQLLPLAWMVGFLLVAYLLGFLIAVPLFILSFMKTHGIGWRKTIISSIITTAVIFAIFEIAMGLELHRGLLLSM